MSADAGRTPYDKPEPVVLRFDRLDSGELVAIHTHEARSVAAIVHTRHDELDDLVHVRRWSLAGDIDPSTRRRGESSSATLACAQAAEALGIELGVEIAGYEVPR